MIMEKQVLNKWEHGIIPGFLIHLCLGTVYSWSVMENQLVSFLGYECSWTFSIFMIFVGIAAFLFSPLVEKNIRVSTWISSGCFILGTILATLACFLKSYLLFNIAYLGFMAISIGLGYLAPIKNTLLWTRKRPGLVVGVILLAFGMSRGISALIFTRANEENLGVIFLAYAISNIIIMTICSIIQRPPEINEEEFKDKKVDIVESLKNWSGKLCEVISLPKIWVYCEILFFGIIAVSSLLVSRDSFSSVIGIELSGTLLVAGLIVNILGRIGTAYISDIVKNLDRIVGIIMYSSVVACIISFINTDFISVTMLLCNFCYGALFTIIPMALYKRYGYNIVARTCGLCFLAWTLGGWIGAKLSNLVFQFPEGTIKTVMLIFSAIYFVGLFYSVDIWESKNTPDKKA